MERKKYLKKVKLDDGKEYIATKHEGDLQWVVPHDHQEKLEKEYEAQEKGNGK